MTRNDLYTAVWSNPVSHVARRIGMSDRGLIEICRTAEIPTPPRGFWRKVRTGQTPERPSLPRPEDDSNVPVNLDRAPVNGGSLPSNGSAVLQVESVAPKEDKPSVLTTTAGPRPTPLSDWLEAAVSETTTAASVRGEYQKLCGLANVFDQHLLVTQFLDQMEASEFKESSRTAAIMRKWVAAMRRHHAKADPVEKVIADFRALSFSRQKPIWWDSM